MSNLQTPGTHGQVERLLFLIDDERIQGHDKRNCLILLARWTRKVKIQADVASGDLELVRREVRALLQACRREARFFDSDVSSLMYNVLCQAVSILQDEDHVAQVGQVLLQVVGESRLLRVSSALWWGEITFGIVRLAQGLDNMDAVWWLLSLWLSVSDTSEGKLLSSVWISFFMETRNAVSELLVSRYSRTNNVGKEDDIWVSGLYSLLKSTITTQRDSATMGDVVLLGCLSGILLADKRTYRTSSFIIQDLKAQCRAAIAMERKDVQVACALAWTGNPFPTDFHVMSCLTTAILSIYESLDIDIIENGSLMHDLERLFCQYISHGSEKFNPNFQSVILHRFSMTAEEMYNVLEKSKIDGLKDKIARRFLGTAVTTLGCLTDGASRLPPKSPFYIAHTLTLLYLWRPGLDSEYTNLLTTAWRCIQSSKEDALDFISALPCVEDLTSNVHWRSERLLAARFQLALSIAASCCNSISQVCKQCMRLFLFLDAINVSIHNPMKPTGHF